jgi:phosphoglycerate dehydrogenase-like enzyme
MSNPHSHFPLRHNPLQLPQLNNSATTDPMATFSIWCNRQFEPTHARTFEAVCSPHRVAWARSMAASNLVAAPSDDALVNECEIACGQPSPEDVQKAVKLKLILLSSAGYTRYDTPAFRYLCRSKSIAVCNASGLYDEPCAQHALAMMLSTVRQLPGAYASQLEARAWPYLPLRSRSDLIGAETVILLVGYGAIAHRLAELLAPLGARVIAFRRTVRGDEGVPTHRVAEVDRFLPDADHVVNILPASHETTNFFDSARLARLKPASHFYNLGRGDTVDQAALVDALNSERLGSAYLDVTSPEPLPSDHPLWTARNCFITPHTAGGTHDESERQIAHFVENLRRYERGETLRDRIF